MKKRNFILISSILCVLVTLSLVITTLVGVLKKNNVSDNAPVNPPVVDTTVDTQEPEDQPQDELTNENRTLLLLVGDLVEDGVLTPETYTGGLFESDGDKLVATTCGVESVSVKVNTTVYSYSITVLEKGDGSLEHPYNIIRAEDLIALVASNEGEFKYYAQQCDLDLSAYESWVPLGKLTAPFLGVYDGNGFAIKNMSINVTPENKDNYIDNAQKVSGSNGTALNIGFFGFVGDPNGNCTSELLNVNIHDAKINTSKIETEQQLIETTLTQSYVAVLAGYVSHTKVVGENSIVTSTIISSLHCDDTNQTRGAVSAFVGGALESELSGYTIKSNITAKNPGTVTAANGGYTYNGTKVVGILGRNNNTNIDNFTVELSVSARNYENMIIAGAVGYIVKPAEAKEIKISNIKVDNLYVSLSQYSYTSNKTGIIAGVAAGNFNENCIIENVEVNNAIVNAIGSGQVAGIIDYNDGVVRNAKVTGMFKGTVVAGVVNTNNGAVEWTNDFADIYAVDVDLRAQTKAAGVAIYNYGKLSGAADKTQIKAVITWSVVRQDFDKIKESAMIAGIAVVSAGENAVVENFYTLTNLVDVINAAGVVGAFGSYEGQEGGVIRNVCVNTTIRTISGNVGSTVYSGQSNMIGGVVAKVGKTSQALAIADVFGNITVNNTKVINTNYKYGLNTYGTMIAVAESSVAITSTNASETLEATIFTNASSAQTQYIGTFVGKVSTGVKITADDNVKIIIAILQTADGAVVA